MFTFMGIIFVHTPTCVRCGMFAMLWKKNKIMTPRQTFQRSSKYSSSTVQCNPLFMLIIFSTRDTFEQMLSRLWVPACARSWKGDICATWSLKATIVSYLRQALKQNKRDECVLHSFWLSERKWQKETWWEKSWIKMQEQC